ncbi:CoA-binding protein [Vallitalea okinawensis]|uniref:CoA-binding protein n=1 Tax=Vallitalea okinawensis TaxID=2078660 RepID=UPI000CFDDCB3|nr:CoA-binding protein [Vallitalea okinawensis]
MNADRAEKMLDKKVWAVVGATVDEDKFGYKIYKRLKEHGYKVYPVSPKYDEIDGDRAYKALGDLPEVPEVVDFVVNPKIGIKVIEQCHDLGIKNVWLQPGTVSEDILNYAKAKEITTAEACVLVAVR